MTERIGYDSQKPHKTRDGQFLWTYASVKNILVEKAYTAVLNNHRREYNNGKAKHRYAGLLSCQECGNVFSPMIRCWNGSRRVEYVCRGYHRNGKGYCSSHRIHEEVLDKAVWDYTEKLREQYAAELKKVAQLQKQWALRRPSLDAHCLALQKEILKLEQEIDELVMEKLKTGECPTRQPEGI